MFHSLLFNIIVLHLIILVSIQVDGKRQELHSFGNPEVILRKLRGEFAQSLHHADYQVQQEMGLDKLVGSVMNKDEAKVAKSSRRYKCLQKELKKIEKKAAKHSGMQCEIPTGLNYKDMETLIDLSRNKYKIINSYNENLCK
ncbi:unnamed protein product [Schistosoma intercalatum]|nr:unnamed protein product [Schistosoma intercalatum]